MQNVEGLSGVVGEISRNGLCLKKLRLEEASHLARVFMSSTLMPFWSWWLTCAFAFSIVGEHEAGPCLCGTLEFGETLLCNCGLECYPLEIISQKEKCLRISLSSYILQHSLSSSSLPINNSLSFTVFYVFLLL